MVDTVRYQQAPQQSSGILDLKLTPGQAQQAGLTALTPGAYGDWTAYFVRETKTQRFSPTNPGSGFTRGTATAKMLVGHDRVGVDSLISNASPEFDLERGRAVHIVGSNLQVIASTPNSTSDAKVDSDRVLAWVAPGRPSVVAMPGVAYIVSVEEFNATVRPNAPLGGLYAAPWTEIPTFATHVRAEFQGAWFAAPPTVPVYQGAFFIDWKGESHYGALDIMGEAFATTATPLARWSDSIPVPIWARYVCFTANLTTGIDFGSLPLDVNWTLQQ